MTRPQVGRPNGWWSLMVPSSGSSEASGIRGLCRRLLEGGPTEQLMQELAEVTGRLLAVIRDGSMEH